MTSGKSIKLFLVDGTPNGIVTAQIANWTGQALFSPRSKLLELLQRDECQKTGVYFLVGEEDENPHFPKVYIGESDDVAIRLKQHNQSKNFWDKVCLITSKDENLTKSHIKYLESRLIEITQRNKQCQLENATAPTYQKLPESDIADMEFFLEQIQIMLPVLGFTFLKSLKTPNSTQSSSEMEQSSSQLSSAENAFFYINNDNLKINATAQEIDGEFIVFKDSSVRQEVMNPNYSYMRRLRPLLFEQGIIDSQSYCFTQDYAFNSPSAAAAVILGRAANGRTEWKQQKTDITYAQWQEQQLEQISPNHIQTEA